LYVVSVRWSIRDAHAPTWPVVWTMVRAAAWTAVKAGRDGGEGVTIGSGGAKALVSRDEALESFGCAIKVRALRKGPSHTQAVAAQVPSTRMIRSSWIADRRALDTRLAWLG